jgi:hypothetical protein
MKILFSADHHIKLGTKNIPVEWARNRFHLLFNELHKLEAEVDVHILGGDFFDKVPSLEELELYYEFVAGCKCETRIISGNHEALKKDTTFLSYLKKLTSRLNSKVQIIDDFHTEFGIDFIPYNKLKQYTPADIDFHSDILVTHVRGEIPPHVKPEIDLSIFDRWKVVLAGDLHSYDNCQRNIKYPGSPITTSFHRNKVDTGVILLDTVTLDSKFFALDLPQLLRKTIQAGEPMLATYPDHTIYEVEGDISELSAVTDNALMDKKITKRNVDTTLILSPEMSIEEEITDYLTYILNVSPNTIDKVLGVYHDYAQKIKL